METAATLIVGFFSGIAFLIIVAVLWAEKGGKDD